MKGKDKFFNDCRSISPKQVELAICIRMYRRMNTMSQEEMAKICTLYGKSKNVKFTTHDISDYENYKRAPRAKKFQILLNTMKITPQTIER